MPSPTPMPTTDIFGNTRLTPKDGAVVAKKEPQAKKEPVKFDGLFTFDFGVLSHPVCGTAHVRGQYGRVKPRIQRPPVDEKTTIFLKDELKDWCTKFWDESPEYIEGMADITNVWTIHTNGSAPILTEKFKVHNRYIAWLWIMDDTFETARDVGTHPVNLMVAANHILDILAGKYNKREGQTVKVPSFEEVPNSRRFQDVFRAMIDIHYTCMEMLPHYQASLVHMTNSIRQYYTNTAWSCAEQIDGRYTEETFCHWRSIDIFIEEIYEFTALFEKVFLPKEVRESTSFLRWIRVSQRLAHTSNDVVGIQKELSTYDGHEGTSGSLVFFKVTQKGIPFEKAIAEICQEMDGLLADYFLLKEIMLKEHCNNPDLIKYIDIVDNIVDGNNGIYIEGKRYRTKGKVDMWWY